MGEEGRKTFGYLALAAISLTSMVGTGLFVGAGIAARFAGNASLIAWGIMALLSLYIAGCFSELVAMFPSAGGVYEYAKQAYGRFVAFLIGWITWLVGNITTVVVLVTAVNYIFPRELAFVSLPFLSDAIIRIILVLFIMAVLNYVAFRGVEASSAVLIFFAIITVGTILLIIFPGFFNIDWSNYAPFIPNFVGDLRLTLFVTIFFIVETFFGWEAATFMAEEVKNPRKKIPRVLMGTTIFVSLLILVLMFVILGNIPFAELMLTDAPLADMLHILYAPQIVNGLNILILFALIGSCLGNVMDNPRLLFSLSRDKLFIEQAADLHPKYKTPGKAILWQFLFSVVILFFAIGNYTILLSMLVPLGLLMYAATFFAVTLLRFSKPHLERPFKLWFGYVGPVLLTMFFIGIIVVWFNAEALLGINTHAFGISRIMLSFVVFAVPIYMLLKVYYDPDHSTSFEENLAPLNILFEKIMLPRHVMNIVMGPPEHLKHKHVLDYGAGVGSLTHYLAKHVGPKGKVYATDPSHKNVDIINKRVKKRGYGNVHAIHDVHHHNRVHPDVLKVDFIFSIGFMGYMQDVERILQQMSLLLPEGGKLRFMEYIDFFHFIPNKKWMNNHELIIAMFHRSGFNIRIKKHKGWFWNYLIIDATKSTHIVPLV